MSCHKLTFRTVEQAERTVSIISGIRGGVRKPRRVYLCPKCDQYHLSGKEEADVSRPSTVLDLASTPLVVVLPVGPIKPVKHAGPVAGSTSQPARGAQEAGLLKVKKLKVDKLAKHVSGVVAIQVRKATMERTKAEWFRQKMREASTFIACGDVLRADSILRACLSMPKKMNPAEDLRACENWVEDSIRAHVEWYAAGRPGATP